MHWIILNEIKIKQLFDSRRKSNGNAMLLTFFSLKRRTPLSSFVLKVKYNVENAAFPLMISIVAYEQSLISSSNP